MDRYIESPSSALSSLPKGCVQWFDKLTTLSEVEGGFGKPE
jgi:hypothetical protein